VIIRWTLAHLVPDHSQMTINVKVHQAKRPHYPVPLAAAGGEPFDAATLWGHGQAD
jgi:hypothetical protein